jgi:glutamate-1-semialdehyde aminotransferase
MGPASRLKVLSKPQDARLVLDQRTSGAPQRAPCACGGVRFLLNRGVLITPFHNMMLVSPATSDADVDRLLRVVGEAIAAFTSR